MRLNDRQKQSLTTSLIALVFVLLFALYANLRWMNESPAFEKPKRTADTPAYLRISGEAFLSKDFWANTRPPVFPFVLKASNTNIVKITTFQTAFSIFSWGILAFAVAYSMKNFLRPVAFSLFLALSLDRHISGWDVVLLTESLSLSFMALFLASWLWLLKSWSWGKVFLLSFVAFMWAFTRDTNGWLLLMISGLILLSVLFFSVRKRNLAIAVVFTVIFVLNNLSADTGGRWVFPFQNVLAQRILIDSDALAFFENCGMPITAELLDLAGGYANSADRAFYQEPALEPYRTWLQASGKSCYIRWLISEPVSNLAAPWVDLERLLVFEEVSRFHPQRYEPILPWYVERILYPQDAGLWLWALTTIAAIVALWKKAWMLNPAWVVFIGLCLLIYPHLFIVWHGDVPGTHRHALTVSLQFVLSFWLLGILILEKLIARFRV